jgi:hypothetical protein
MKRWKKERMNEMNEHKMKENDMQWVVMEWNEWMNEWKSGWINERVNEWMNESINQINQYDTCTYIYVYVYLYNIHSNICCTKMYKTERNPLGPSKEVLDLSPLRHRSITIQLLCGQPNWQPRCDPDYSRLNICVCPTKYLDPLAKYTIVISTSSVFCG